MYSAAILPAETSCFLVTNFMPVPALSYTQSDFSGGMNLLDIDTALQPNEYRVGINIRNRFSVPTPIKSETVIMDGLPSPLGFIQGLYSFGNLLVLFAGGLAWYKRPSDDQWIDIPGFLMSTAVDRYYCQAVPVSSLVYDRSGGGNPSAPVTLLNTTTTPSPAVLVVQDGVNQPWLIFPDASNRQAQTYAEWSLIQKEYVPVGKQMVYFNGILFVVSADGKSVYRSVSGRPLDFVVAVDGAGNKVSDASNTSFAIDSNEIKLFSQLNADSLVAITAYAAYSITLDFTDTIFGEPRFNRTYLFQAGATNQFSFADILGDYAFIDKEGLKSFNAVTQIKFEGNNSVFSLSVAALFHEIIQTDPCVGSFDNYTLFAVKTNYSPNSILVYDNIKKKFVSVDIITPQPVRQFAVTYDAAVQRCFAATTNMVYELFSPAQTTYKDAVLFTRAFNSTNSDQGSTAMLANIRTDALKIQFSENSTAGARVKINEFVNDKFDVSAYIRNILTFSGGVLYPVGGPCIATMNNYITPLDIPFKGREGQKIAYSILWFGGAKLIFFQSRLLCKEAATNKSQEETIYNN